MSELRLHDDNCPALLNPPGSGTCTCPSGQFELHQLVEKNGGDYLMPGRIVSIYRTYHSKRVRFVVESTSEDTRGLQHIMNATQLRAR